MLRVSTYNLDLIVYGPSGSCSNALQCRIEPPYSALLMIGGQTTDHCLASMYRLRLIDGKLRIDELATMPNPSSNTAGALLDGVIYVAGGQETPSSTIALKTLRAYRDGGWKTLEDWPGAPAILPVATAAGGWLYVLGGAELTGAPGPQPSRRFLRQALRCRPGKGWERLPELPQPSQAGYALPKQNDILLFGGNDGSLSHREYEVRDTHPGFLRQICQFSATHRIWRQVGSLPGSLLPRALRCGTESS